MIDAPGRPTPRFPRDKVEAAKRAIREAVLSEQQSTPIAYGMAGAASGGDILFHQVCEELSISTRIFLALPRDQYVASSVAHGGPEWVQEFDRLNARSFDYQTLKEEAEADKKLYDELVRRIREANIKLE